MKTYKVMRGYAPVGKAGEQVQLKDDRFTQSLLKQGIIAELKIEAPTETKKRKPRAKKAD
jgi:hypothetical protein